MKTAASIHIGEELPALSKEISQRQIDAFSGVRFHSIHTDPEWARKKGFAAPLAMGMMSAAYAWQMMLQYFGEGFVEGGKLNVAFIEPVLSGDRLTLHGTVKSIDREGSETRVNVELWCENQRGVKTMVGTASGLVA